MNGECICDFSDENGLLKLGLLTYIGQTIAIDLGPGFVAQSRVLYPYQFLSILSYLYLYGVWKNVIYYRDGDKHITLVREKP